jgi:Peptidase family M28
MKVLVVLDQASGQALVDTDDQGIEQVVGIEWLPSTERALELVRKKGIVTVAGLPLAPALVKGVVDGLGGEADGPQALGDGSLLESVQRWCKQQSGSGRYGVICADGMVRHSAEQAGASTYAHAMLAAWDQAELGAHLVLVRCGEHELTRLAEPLCYRLHHLADGRKELLLAVTDAALGELMQRRLEVVLLPSSTLGSDLKILRGPWKDGSGAKELPVSAVLASFNNGDVLVAVTPGMDASALSLHGAHGHDELLLPQPLSELLRKPTVILEPPGSIIDRLPRDILERIELPPWVLWPRLGCPVSASDYQAILDRYTGITALDADGTIASRHISHPDNSRVVSALVAELRSMGYCAHTHAFTYGGRTLYNVIADLPGQGYFVVKASVLKHLRSLIQRPFAKDPVSDQVKELVGMFSTDPDNMLEVPPMKRSGVVARLKEVLQVRPWFPYWLRCLVLWPGFGSRIVVVGCHLDSTAQSSGGYDPLTDPAPGRDDNASGLAATLAIARQFTALRGCLRHTVRFCFFNAEEQGLVGSKAYAAMLKAANAPVKAAVCMDMIGYNSDAQRLFEIHAGYSDAAVRDASVPIADRIAHWADVQGRLAPAQVYKGTATSAAPPNSANRDVVDGAINRSDHAAFHQQGWPAVVVTEDFFANASSEPASDPNPNYHRTSDTVVDHAFAADITCAVARAVRELAGG